MDSELTPTWGISEERDMMKSHGPQKNVLNKSSFLETCELEQHQEIPIVKNIRRKVLRESTMIGSPSDEECGNASAIFLTMLDIRESTLGRNPLSVSRVWKSL